MTIPLYVAGKLIGALSFNTIREKRSWSENFVKRLQLVAEILASAIARRSSDQELQESAERLGLVSESAGMGLWILDLSTGQFWATDRALELFGLPPGYALDLDKLSQIVHPEDRERVLRAVHEASQSNVDTRIEYRVVRADNSTRWIMSRGRKRMDPSSKALKLMGASFDITERKEAEARRTEAESMVRAVLESTEDMIWSVDPHRFGLLTFNSALGDYFRKGMGLEITKGMSPDDMVGGPFTPAVAATWRAFYRRALREGPFSEEYEVSARGKILLLSFGLLKRDEEIFGISVFGKDITQRKQMEDKIETAAREWQSTFDSIPDLVLILDKDFRIIQANAATSAFLNLPPESIVGNHYHTLLYGPDYPFRDSPLAMVAETKRADERDVYDDRRQKWLHVSVNPILDETGEIGRAVCMIKDITASRAAETEASNARRELLRMERLSRMGELTASLAHELNQPLTSILSNARAGLRFIDSGTYDFDELKDIFRDIAQDDKRAGEVIRSLRAMVRPVEAQRVWASINDILRDAVLLFNSEAIIRNIRVKTSLAHRLPMVNVDVVQIQQVITNLLMNAADSMDDGTAKKKITVRAEATKGNNVRVAVSDLGSGIEEKDLGKIFDPFFTTKNSGLGMGLSLSRSIIEAHGGRIRAENNPDKGSTIYFDLPTVEKDND